MKKETKYLILIINTFIILWLNMHLLDLYGLFGINLRFILTALFVCVLDILYVASLILYHKKSNSIKQI